MESWQVEMVIFGVVIFGLFQLFDVVNWMVDWCYFNLLEGFMGLVYFFCFYFLIVVVVLVMSFLVYFVICVLWIVVIGLESVYFQGFCWENDFFSIYFMDQLIVCFLSFSIFNYIFDWVVSVLLVYVLLFVMIFVGIGIVFLVFFFLGYMLVIFIEDDMVVNIVYGFIVLYVGVIYFNVILSIKCLCDKVWVQCIYFFFLFFVGSYFIVNIFV